VVLVALGVAFLLFAIAGRHPARPTGSSGQSGSVSSIAVLPGYEKLSPAQRLDRALSLPGMHGIVRGTVGPETVTTLPDGEMVMDFAFRITDARPTARPPERVGASLTLRVPGGCMSTGNLRVCATAEDSPQVAAGDDVFVFVRDQGSFYGGSTTTRLVASSSADVFTVRGGLVYGQGAGAGSPEPVDTFLRHFGA
jgi:hypothetical protein